MNKTKRDVKFEFKWPGMVYCFAIYAANEREARDMARKMYNPKAKRLPVGFEIWKA